MSKAAAQPAKKNRAKKWALIVGAVVVLSGAAGAAAQFLVRPGSGEAAEAGQERRRDPIFVALDQFTVNLADEGGERFAQIGVTLEVVDEKADKAIRTHMPSIRNSVLLLLSSKSTSELLTLDGKKRLAEQIAARAGGELGWTEPAEGAAPRRPNPIAAVHFSHFIVQ